MSFLFSDCQAVHDQLCECSWKIDHQNWVHHPAKFLNTLNVAANYIFHRQILQNGHFPSMFEANAQRVPSTAKLSSNSTVVPLLPSNRLHQRLHDNGGAEEE